MGGWGYALMTVSSVLFWAVVILGVVALVRYLARPSEPRSGGSAADRTPETLLGQRFARGEIDEQEYRSRMATLEEAHHAAS